jgi:DNA invertase Pin-like site-specific DNA recombinase
MAYHRNIGYARKLPRTPSLAQQVRLLRHTGCWLDDIWQDDGSDLELAVTQAVEGDTFIVARLEAVFVPNKVFRWVLEELQRKRVHFRALDVGIDTRAAHGDLAIAALLKHLDSKRDFIRSVTLAGLAKARQQGRIGGRRVVLSPDKRAEAIALIEAGELSMAEIAKRLGVSRSSLYNANLSARSKEKGRH